MRRLLSIILCLCMLSLTLSSCNAPNGGVTEESESSPSVTDTEAVTETDAEGNPVTTEGAETQAPPSSSPSEGGSQGGSENQPLTGDAYYAVMNYRNDVLTPLKNDFRSRTAVTYRGINGKDVTAYTFYREPNEGMNNPNFAQAVMLWQCIQYKIAHPEEKVVATFSTFHLSVRAAACLDPKSAEYGRMENLYDKEYDEATGYYRVSWLMVDAARHGVEMLVIGDLDAAAASMSNGTSVPDGDHYQYFMDYLDDDALIAGKKIGDFLTFRRADWTSYGDKSATDMMHLKICTVSHRLGNDGTEHGPAIWMGSINLDGVNDLGYNQHNSIQSGVVITEHEELRRVMYNYMNLLKDYCGQEDVTAFRNLVISRTTKQVALLREGRGAEIPADEQIVYMGSESDSVFELYFTPFGGNQNQWDVTYNPFCRYLGKLLAGADGENWIQLIWNNVKFKASYGLADTMTSVIAKAFLKNQHEEDLLLLHLPGMDLSAFEGLPVTERVRLNTRWFNYHIKDLQLSYVENGQRQWVVVYNTLNMHEGSMAYQSNVMLIVKENEETGNHFYTDYAILTTPDANFEKYRIDPKQ